MALLAGFLAILLLDGGLVGRLKPYRVEEVVRGRYLSVSLLLTVLDFLLGVLDGAGSALLARQRGAPIPRQRSH